MLVRVHRDLNFDLRLLLALLLRHGWRLRPTLPGYVVFESEGDALLVRRGRSRAPLINRRLFDLYLLRCVAR